MKRAPDLPRRHSNPTRVPPTLSPPVDARGKAVLALGPEDAAHALGIGKRLLWEKSINGEIPSLKVGNRRLYSVDALRLYLIENGSKGGEL